MSNYETIEKDFLNELNKVRQNPQSIIPVLEKLLTQFSGNILKRQGEVPLQTNEGQSAVKEAISFLKKTSPLSEFKLNPQLSLASKSHVNDIGPKGITDHYGSDGSDPYRRMKRFCKFEGEGGENIDFGSKTGLDSLISFIIDDGVTDRGHRRNILNPIYKTVGLSVGYHSEFETVLVINFVEEIYDESKLNKESKESKVNNQINKGKLPEFNDIKKENIKKVDFKRIENDFLLELNKARQNPSYLIPFLEDRIQYFDGTIYKPRNGTPIQTNEGVSGINDAISYLQKLKPLQKYEKSINLCKASKRHLDDIGKNGLSDHYGSDGSDPTSRINMYVDFNSFHGEVIDFGSDSGLESLLCLVIDDGLKSRGHRNQIFNKEYKYIGVSAGTHIQMDTCLVADFVDEINNEKRIEKSNDKEVLERRNIVDYELIIDSNDNYIDNKDINFVSSNKINSISSFEKDYFSLITIKDIGVDKLTPSILKDLKRIIKPNCPVNIIINQKLRVLQSVQSNLLISNLRFSGFKSFSIGEYEDNSIKSVYVEAMK